MACRAVGVSGEVMAWKGRHLKASGRSWSRDAVGCIKGIVIARVWSKESVGLEHLAVSEGREGFGEKVRLLCWAKTRRSLSVLLWSIISYITITPACQPSNVFNYWACVYSFKRHRGYRSLSAWTALHTRTASRDVQSSTVGTD